MRLGEIQAKLAATNGWWRLPRDWTRRDPDLQEASGAPFTHSAGVLDDLARGGLYVLRGPRRVGKSVELKRTQAIASHIRHRLPDESLQQALFGVISGDAFQRARLSDPQTTGMLRRLTRGLGSQLNSAKLAREIDVSLPTAQRRINDLRESFVVWPVHRENGLRPSLRAQKKIYFIDPIYTRIGYSDARAVDETALSEQQLGMALLRSSLRDGHSSYADFDRVLHFRSATGAEIDFVGPDFGGLAIESKYVDGRWRKSAGRTLTASPWTGLVATRTELDLDGPETVAAPTAMLAWLIDA